MSKNPGSLSTSNINMQSLERVTVLSVLGECYDTVQMGLRNKWTFKAQEIFY